MRPSIMWQMKREHEDCPHRHIAMTAIQPYVGIRFFLTCKYDTRYFIGQSPRQNHTHTNTHKYRFIHQQAIIIPIPMNGIFIRRKIYTIHVDVTLLEKIQFSLRLPRETKKKYESFMGIRGFEASPSTSSFFSTLLFCELMHAVHITLYDI